MDALSAGSLEGIEAATCHVKHLHTRLIAQLQQIYERKT